MNLSCFHFKFQNNRLTGEARFVHQNSTPPENTEHTDDQNISDYQRRIRRDTQRNAHELRRMVGENPDSPERAARLFETQMRNQANIMQWVNNPASRGRQIMDMLKTKVLESFQDEERTEQTYPESYPAWVRNEWRMFCVAGLIRHANAIFREHAKLEEGNINSIITRTFRTNGYPGPFDTWVGQAHPNVHFENREVVSEPVADAPPVTTAPPEQAPATATTAPTENRGTATVAPAETPAQATAPGEQPAAPGETPQASGTPETPADQNENPVSWLSAAFAAVGGFVGGAMGEKISRAGTWLQEGLTKLLGKMPVSIRYAFGLSNEKLRGLGVAVNGADDLDPSGTGLSPWRVMVMPEAQLRVFVRAARRLDMVSEETRGKLLEMKFSEFARKLPTQLSSDSAEQTQLARLKTFLNEKGAPPNEIMAVVLGRIITDQQWNDYSPESARTPNTPLVQPNHPGETPQTPETRTNNLFASIRTAGELSADAEQVLRHASAKAIAEGTLHRPANVPERAWNTIYNALHGQQIADASMTVDQFLQQKFQNQNYNPAIATA